MRGKFGEFVALELDAVDSDSDWLWEIVFVGFISDAIKSLQSRVLLLLLSLFFCAAAVENDEKVSEIVWMSSLTQHLNKQK